MHYRIWNTFYRCSQKYQHPLQISRPLCIAATIGFAYVFMKKIEFRLQKGSGFYIAGMILLGISTAYTSSFFFHFFNMAGIILLFFVFMIHQFYNDYIYFKMSPNIFENIKSDFKSSGNIMHSMPAAAAAPIPIAAAVRFFPLLSFEKYAVPYIFGRIRIGLPEGVT